MNTERSFEWLQSFYQSNCDGDWEHDFGGWIIQSESTPGWLITINLSGTPYEGAKLEELEDQSAPISWLRCKIEGGKFVANCSPKRLAECIDILRDVIEGRRGDSGQKEQNG